MIFVQPFRSTASRRPTPRAANLERGAIQGNPAIALRNYGIPGDNVPPRGDDLPRPADGLERVRHGFCNRHMAAALRRADAIVLHSKDTHKRFVETFPDLKKRVHVVPIPIERPATEAVEPTLRKNPLDTWVMVPGFVSRYEGHAHVLAALRQLPDGFKIVVAGGIHPKDRTGHDYWMELVQQADVFVLPYDEAGQWGRIYRGLLAAHST